MPIRPNLPVGVTSITPPAVDVYSKFVRIDYTDTTAFDAFVMPKGAVISGVFINSPLASNAVTTAVINIGTNPGTTNEVLAAFDVKGATGQGFYTAGAKAGSAVGQINASQAGQTTDVLYKAKYSDTGGAASAGGPWLVEVEYYFPQQGATY